MKGRKIPACAGLGKLGKIGSRVEGRVMSEPESLMLQFLTWVSDRPRTYEDTMAAWQSTCPRHTIWEDAIIGGLVRIESANGSGQSQVILTPRGRAMLAEKNSQDPLCS
jgi:hypothetical protein